MLLANKGKNFMKRILALGLTCILAIPIFSTAVVWAEDTTTPTTTETTTTTTTPEITETKPTDQEVAARNARVEKRKADMKTKLTSAEKLRIQAKCKASQGLIGSVKGR